MSDATDQVLTQAYELIESGNLEEAEALLKPVLASDQDNVDAWWLYAHAVSDPEEARNALNQVLKLDSSYEEARGLLDQLNETHPAPQAQVPPPPTLPQEIVDEPILDQPDDEAKVFDLKSDDLVFGDRPEETRADQPAQNRGWLWVAALFLLVLVAVVAVVAIANPFATQATPTTAPAAQLQPTTLAEMDAVSDDVQQAVDNALGDLEAIAIGSTETAIGNTLIGSFCKPEDQPLPVALDRVMQAMANTATDAGSFDALGVAMVDCAMENTVLRVIGIPVSDATAFVNGQLDAAAFRSRWQAVA
jgi:tetratricopeptide (TPR) repeat protein